MTAVGNSIPRFDVKDKATGAAMYPGDYNMPDQALHEDPVCRPAACHC